MSDDPREPDPAADPAPAVEPEPAQADQPVASPPALGAPRGRRLAPLLVVVGLVAAFAGGLLVGRVTAPAASSLAQASAPPAASASSPGPTAPLPSLPSDGPRLGSADAAVVIDYWADYQCPFCASFAKQVIPALRSRIEDGTVQLVHRDFAFLGPESLDAAVAVRCAAREGRYWQMHDAVYAAQQGENQGAFARPRLASIAAGVGLDAAAFETCLDEREPLVEVLDDTSAGIRTGIASTPTAEVNGRRFTGVPDIADLLATIDAAAAGASPAAAPTAAPRQDDWSAVETDGRTAGPAAAPVTVELWMDYQSPDGALVAQAFGPALRTRIAAGGVRAELHDAALLGEESVTAASFVDCVAAQDGPAWLVHDIFASSGRGADTGLFVPVNLLRLSSQLGLDVRAVNACLEDPASAATVRARTAEGAAADVTAGPTVIIRKDGDEVARFVAPLDAEAFAAALDDAE